MERVPSSRVSPSGLGLVVPGSGAVRRPGKAPLSTEEEGRPESVVRALGNLKGRFRKPWPGKKGLGERQSGSSEEGESVLQTLPGGGGGGAPGAATGTEALAGSAQLVDSPPNCHLSSSSFYKADGEAGGWRTTWKG